MKTKIAFILLLVFSASSLSAQPLFWNSWQQTATGTTSNLNYVMDNSGKYYAVGDNGTILTSTNSGLTWALQNTGFANSLRGIFSITYICGSNGLIAKSTNNGLNYFAQSSGSINNLNSVFFIGGAYGIVVGDNGTALQTTTGGTNWNPVSLGISTNLNFITSYGELKGLIVGDNGEVFKTYLQVPGFTYFYTRLSTGTNLNLKHAVVLDSNNIWIAASNGKLLHTTNAGASWQIVNTGFTNNLNYISIPSAGTIYVSGAGGLILKSTNAGVSFTQLTSNTTADLKGVIVKNNIGSAIGAGGIAMKNILSGSGGLIGVKQQGRLDPGNISTWIWNTGVFNQDLRTSNTPGFSWGPKEMPGVGIAKFAIFTTGLSIAGFVNGEFRMASASYSGEYTGGYIENGIAKTSSDFQVFRVAEGDNCNTSVDYANWQAMIPFGAPYRDVNSNGQYDACIDIPGVKNASQTVFVCLTDGFSQTHSISEGFGGGTAPMNAEIHLTAWAYKDSLSGVNLSDVQFIKWDIINKNNTPWNSFYSSIVCDPDLGDADDDYIGCDTTRNLGYCFNSDDIDGNGTGTSYGNNPPAVGMRFLRTPIRRGVGPNDTLGLTSFCPMGRSIGPVCEQDPSASTGGAYNYMRGFKKDGTPWLNPINTPPTLTKFCYSGEPQTAAGWTEYFGRIENCGGVLTGNVVPSPPGDRKYVMSSGRDNFTFNAGDTQTVIMAQMMAKGSNNKNAVTKLKALSDIVYNSFKSGSISIGINYNPSAVVNSFMLYQNYPNPFNPSTKIKFQIPENTFASLKIYDVSGKEISTVVNENLQRGEYEYQWNASNFPSGVYFYRLETDSFTQTRKLILVK